MKPTLAHSLTGFDSITLDQLNSTMSLMERVDTKYVINYAQADQLIQTLKDKFFILQIKDKVIFKYDNVYMDTDNNDLFFSLVLSSCLKSSLNQIQKYKHSAQAESI